MTDSAMERLDGPAHRADCPPQVGSTATGGGELRGLEFLEEFEARHDRLLSELDALNARIERVLDAHLQSRSPAAQPSGADS